MVATIEQRLWVLEQRVKTYFADLGDFARMEAFATAADAVIAEAPEEQREELLLALEAMAARLNI